VINAVDVILVQLSRNVDSAAVYDSAKPCVLHSSTTLQTSVAIVAVEIIL
jgi:hypothetical protein